MEKGKTQEEPMVYNHRPAYNVCQFHARIVWLPTNETSDDKDDKMVAWPDCTWWVFLRIRQSCNPSCQLWQDNNYERATDEGRNKGAERKRARPSKLIEVHYVITRETVYFCELVKRCTEVH